MNLATSLDEISNRALGDGGNLSVLLKTLRGGRLIYSRAPELAMKSASTIKLLILISCLESCDARALREVVRVEERDKVPYSLVTFLDAGEWLLGDLLKLMISTSDNTATNLVIRRVGFEAINRTAQRMGLEQTRLRRLMMDGAAAARGEENTSSLADQCRMYERLWHGEDAWATEALEILRQVADVSALLRFFSEDECPLSHKTGGLPDVHHDAGIFHADCGDYFLGVFTAGMPEPESKELIGRLARAAYDSREEWFA